MFNVSSGWSFRISHDREKIMTVETPRNEIMNIFFLIIQGLSLDFHIPNLHLKWGKESPYHPWDWYIYQHEWFIFMVNINVGKCTSPMDPMGYSIFKYILCQRNSDLLVVISWVTFFTWKSFTWKWSSGKRNELPALETSIFLGFHHVKFPGGPCSYYLEDHPTK